MATQTELAPVRTSDLGGGAPAASERWWDVAAVAGPVVLAVALCLYELSGRSLWLDEAATVAIAGQHGSALWHAIGHDGGNMLGYYALLHVLIGWFGDAAFVIRLPSALAAGGEKLGQRIERGRTGSEEPDEACLSGSGNKGV